MLVVYLDTNRESFKEKLNAESEIKKEAPVPNFD